MLVSLSLPKFIYRERKTLPREREEKEYRGMGSEAGGSLVR
jgi:hypothetical protein